MTSRYRKFELALEQAKKARKEFEKIHLEHSSVGFDYVQIYCMDEIGEKLKMLVESLELRCEHEKLKHRVASIAESYPVEKDDPEDERFKWR